MSDPQDRAASGVKDDGFEKIEEELGKAVADNLRKIWDEEVHRCSHCSHSFYQHSPFGHVPCKQPKCHCLGFTVMTRERIIQRWRLKIGLTP